MVQALATPPLLELVSKLLDFKPFNPVDKRTEITYREESSGKLKRVTKGMTGIIIDLCTRNKTEAQENQLEQDVEEYATRGLRALAVAFEEVPGDDPQAEGEGFELIGLLAIFDPPAKTPSKLSTMRLPWVSVSKWSRETNWPSRRRLGAVLDWATTCIPPKFSKKVPSLDLNTLLWMRMIMDADGFAGVFPEHKYEIVKRLQGLGHLCAMTGDGANDAPAAFPC